MIAPCSGSYLALPTNEFALTVAVDLGHGTLITTLLAFKFLSNIDFTLTLISNLFAET